MASRFTDRVDFPGYSGPELIDILLAMAAQEEYILTPEAEERALAWFEAQRAACAADFGNGRAARRGAGRGGIQARRPDGQRRRRYRRRGAQHLPRPGRA
jgi:hypothetical protein